MASPNGAPFLSAGGIPDISGYNMIYIQPPILSGLYNPENNPVSGGNASLSTYGHQSIDPGLAASFMANSKDTVFLAQDVTPPEMQIINSDFSSTVNIKIPYAIGKTNGGNLTISYLENSTLDIYNLHHTWVHYIEDVMLGQVNPSDYYIDSYTLDYTTCIYILKYKPDLMTPVYFGKAIGVFPISIPTKEIIGTRGSYQTTVYTVSYVCTDFQDIVLRGDGSHLPANGPMGAPTGANARLLADLALVYGLFGLTGLVE